MSLLRSLLAGFSASSSPSTRPAKATNDTYGISYMVLMKGFQLFNAEIFDITENPAPDNKNLTALISAYKSCNSLVEDHLSDRKNTTVITLNEHIREDGSFCVYIEYDNKFETEKGQETIQWASLLMGITENAGTESARIESQVIITGYLNSGAENTESYFIPQDIRCLGELNGEPTYFAPETNFDLTGLFAYGNQAFLQLIAGIPLNKLENQKWAQIDDHKTLEHAANICRRMRTRTGESLEDDLTALLIRDQVMALAEGIFPQPTR